MNSRLLSRQDNSRESRQSSGIDDMMYSSKNWVPVEEELSQFDHTFKQLYFVHKEYHNLFNCSEKINDDE